MRAPRLYIRAMATVEEGLAAQVRNIEKTYGKSMAQWTELVRDRGLVKHGEIIAMLKAEYGLTHGSANRVALVVRDALAGTPPTAKVQGPEALFAGKHAPSLPIHDAVMNAVRAFGADVEVAPKRAYLSLRRRKQFAMLQPAAGRVDVGLILPGAPPTGRLEASGSFNAMFSHRVRVGAAAEVDAELAGWLRRAYDAAG